MVPIQQEPAYMGYRTAENCCFCRKPTRFWHKDTDVACCQSCAELADEEDMPTKKQWLRRERIAERRRWNQATGRYERLPLRKESTDAPR